MTERKNSSGQRNSKSLAHTLHSTHERLVLVGPPNNFKTSVLEASEIERYSGAVQRFDMLWGVAQAVRLRGGRSDNPVEIRTETVFRKRGRHGKQRE